MCVPRGLADFFGDVAIARSNNSVPSRLFLDPYHVSDGNLWAENFLMGRFQKGGMTSLAGRSELLRMEKERFGKEDMQSRARSKYLEPEGGRFVPPLKPACARDKGPDPYDTHKHATWIISNTGCANPPSEPCVHTHEELSPDDPLAPRRVDGRFAGGRGAKAKTAPSWSTHSLSRPSCSQ